MKLIQLSPLLSLLLFVSCAANDPEPPTPTPLELLTASAWTSVKDFDDSDLDGIFEEFSRDCEEDNPWLFTADMKVTVGAGTALCNPDDDPTEQYSLGWRLESNNQILVLEFGADEAKYKIEKLEQNQLSILEVDPSTPNVFTHRIIFTR